MEPPVLPTWPAARVAFRGVVLPPSGASSSHPAPLCSLRGQWLFSQDARVLLGQPAEDCPGGSSWSPSPWSLTICTPSCLLCLLRFSFLLLFCKRKRRKREAKPVRVIYHSLIFCRSVIKNFMWSLLPPAVKNRPWAPHRNPSPCSHLSLPPKHEGRGQHWLQEPWRPLPGRLQAHPSSLCVAPGFSAGGCTVNKSDQ